MSNTIRYAVVTGGLNVTLKLVKDYLPSNYTATMTPSGSILIEGTDNAGWTMDGYVLPRLASGLIAVKEIDNPEELHDQVS